MTGAYMLIDLLLSGGINYLLQKQQVDALINKARAEQRDITLEELEVLKNQRAVMAAETDAMLDEAANR